MSTVGRTGWEGRRWLTVALALLAVLLVGLVGNLLPTQSAAFRPSPQPLAGRTSSTCTTSAEPSATATLAAVAVRQAPGRRGTLTGVPVGTLAASITLTEQGKARSLAAPKGPVILEGEGIMATAASAMMFSQARSGSLTGLMAAPCTPPNTEHWFVGVGASADYRTELVLTNPDDGQAEVDLRFYGRSGIVVVPGSPGLIIDGRTSRTVSLQSLVEVEGPLTVSVRASEGRVSAMALDRRSTGTQPQGADWQSSSVAPTATMIVPGVLEGTGARELVVANPGPDRAEVGIEVLGIEGAFAPTGAETLVVPPESTASVGLTGGLAGQAGSIRLTSTQPVTAAAHAVSSVQGSRPDLSVQPAVTAFSRTGVVALASIEGVDAEFVLSNGGAEDVQLSFEVLSYEGVRLRTDDVTLIGGGTSSRRITLPAPAYLVVRAPPDAAIFGSVGYRWSTGNVAGIASVPVTSPDLAGRAPHVRFDPELGQ